MSLKYKMVQNLVYNVQFC